MWEGGEIFHNIHKSDSIERAQELLSQRSTLSYLDFQFSKISIRFVLSLRISYHIFA